MKYLLFTTTSCPKCPVIKDFVATNIDFEGEIIDETLPNFTEKISEIGVTVAPTIIIFDKEKEVFRGNEISEIEEFLKTL